MNQYYNLKGNQSLTAIYTRVFVDILQKIIELMYLLLITL